MEGDIPGCRGDKTNSFGREVNLWFVEAFIVVRFAVRGACPGEEQRPWGYLPTDKATL